MTTAVSMAPSSLHLKNSPPTPHNSTLLSSTAPFTNFPHPRLFSIGNKEPQQQATTSSTPSRPASSTHIGKDSTVKMTSSNHHSLSFGSVATYYSPTWVPFSSSCPKHSKQQQAKVLTTLTDWINSLPYYLHRVSLYSNSEMHPGSVRKFITYSERTPTGVWP